MTLTPSPLSQGFTAVTYLGETVTLKPQPVMDRSLGLFVYSCKDETDTRRFVAGGNSEMIWLDDLLAVAAHSYDSPYHLAMTWVGGAHAAHSQKAPAKSQLTPKGNYGSAAIR